MVRLAALLVIDAPQGSYNASAELALASGASLDEIVGILAPLPLQRERAEHDRL